jgi:hypothetical protein
MNVPKRAVAGLVVVAVASLALVLTPAGSARELRPTGTTATYNDATGDAKSAPDISTVALDLDAPSGALKIEVTLANNDDLSNRGGVFVFLNTDRNSGTGDRLGSDYAILIFADGMALLKWNGKEMDIFSHQPTILARQTGKIMVVVCTCDLGTQAFDFTVASIRGEDVDVAPDTAPVSFPVQENAVSIESLLVAPKPLRPTAGKRFTVSIAGVRLGGSNEVVAPDTYSCSATLAGRALKGKGVGGCSWLLPKKARGKKLIVSVNVSYHGDSETFSQTYKVR